MAAAANWDFLVGQPADAAIEVFGEKPSARMKVGANEILLFPQVEITVTDGVIVKVQAKRAVPRPAPPPPRKPAATSRAKPPVTPPVELPAPPVTPREKPVARQPVARPNALYFGSIAIEFDNIDFAVPGSSVETEVVGNARTARTVFGQMRREFRKYSLPALQKDIDVIYFVRRLQIDGEDVEGAVRPDKRAICLTTVQDLHEKIALLILKRRGNSFNREGWEELRDTTKIDLLKFAAGESGQPAALARLHAEGILNEKALQSLEHDVVAVWHQLMTDKGSLVALAEKYPPMAARVKLLAAFLESWFRATGGSLSDSSLDL